MSIIICPSDNDNHAPFAHRLVMPNNIMVKHGQLDVLNEVQPVLVVCAYCDHWVLRVAGRCRCTVDCHARMRENSYQPVTKTPPIRRKSG